MRQSAGIVAAGLIGASPASGAAGTRQRDTAALRALGGTGLLVTPLCYGASRTQNPGLVRTALDSGIHFIDTGRSYANGQNEVMLGKALKGIRKDIVIQSKARVRISETGKALNTKTVRDRIQRQLSRSLEESLKALQTDYIDILLLHNVRTEDILFNEAVVAFFRESKKAGKIRAHGFSSHANQVDLTAAANRNPFYDVIMVPYNHKGSYVHSLSGQYSEWDQPRLEEEMKKAAENNTGIIAMKTCSAGPCASDEKSKPSYSQALKWVIDHSFVHSAAAAMANFDEIEEDLKAMKN